MKESGHGEHGHEEEKKPERNSSDQRDRRRFLFGLWAARSGPVAEAVEREDRRLAGQSTDEKELKAAEKRGMTRRDFVRTGIGLTGAAVGGYAAIETVESVGDAIDRKQWEDADREHRKIIAAYEKWRDNMAQADAMNEPRGAYRRIRGESDATVPEIGPAGTGTAAPARGARGERGERRDIEVNLHGDLAREIVMVAAACKDKLATRVLLGLAPETSNEVVQLTIIKQFEDLVREEIGKERIEKYVGSADERSAHFRRGGTFETYYRRIIDNREKIMRAVQRLSKEHEVPERIIYNVMANETPPPRIDLYRPGQALGIMQVMKEGAIGSLREKGRLPRRVADVWGNTAAVESMVANDHELNIEIAVVYLRELFDEFGTWDLALSAYNGGPGLLKTKLAVLNEDGVVYGASTLRGSHLRGSGVNAVTLRAYGDRKLQELEGKKSTMNEAQWEALRKKYDNMRPIYPFEAEGVGELLWRRLNLGERVRQ